MTAARLAEAGRSVLVLERGKAYPPGSFPRTPWEIGRAFWDPSESLHGLYDVWSFHRLDSIVSSGLGGGSLIYANVILRRPESWFADQGDERWPIGPADLEEHYEAVEPSSARRRTRGPTARPRSAASARRPTRPAWAGGR